MTLTLLAHSPWLIVAAVLVAVLGVGRLARIITYDAFPPAAWLRSKWDNFTADSDGDSGPWSLLAHCFWCATPWIMLICLAWFFVGTLVLWVAIVWWVFWGWLALSYVASMILARDEPE